MVQNGSCVRSIDLGLVAFKFGFTVMLLVAAMFSRLAVACDAECIVCMRPATQLKLLEFRELIKPYAPARVEIVGTAFGVRGDAQPTQGIFAACEVFPGIDRGGLCHRMC